MKFWPNQHQMGQIYDPHDSGFSSIIIRTRLKVTPRSSYPVTAVASFRRRKIVLQSYLQPRRTGWVPRTTPWLWRVKMLFWTGFDEDKAG